MTLSNLQKAKDEQTSIKVSLGVLEVQLAKHRATPLSESEVDNYLEKSKRHQDDLSNVYIRILNSSPADADVQEAAHIALLTQAMVLVGQFGSIKSRFQTATTSTRTTATAAPPTQEIRLPRLELQQFNGDATQWASFRDMFTAAVDKRGSLSKVEKLTYLKTLLTGEAARQIQNFALTDGNYDLAWKALCDRYENEREQIFSILKKLFSQQQVQPISTSLRSLLDTTKGCIRSFTCMKGQLDHLLVYIVFTKMDSATKELWFQCNQVTKIPSLDEVYTFLEQRAMALSAGASSSSSRQHKPEQKVHNHHVQIHQKCTLSCPDSHRLFKCDKFLKLSVQQRVDHVKAKNLCYNCLHDSHSANSCKSSQGCKVCSKKHHTLLHFTTNHKNNSTPAHLPKPDPTPGSSQGSSQGQAMSHHGFQTGEIPPALLATAVIHVKGRYGYLMCRALIDNGASNSFITQACARRLALAVQGSATTITGLSSSNVGSSVGTTDFIMTPRFAISAPTTVHALVIPAITSKLPNTIIDTTQWSHLEGLELADPDFNKPSTIDILLGSDIFWDILKQETKRGLQHQPIAVNSKLGWLVGGQIHPQPTPRVNCFLTNIELDQRLEKFWESENSPSSQPVLTQEEEATEKHFNSTVSRDFQGRFITPIPWKHPRQELGESRKFAIRRLLSMERRLSSSEKFKRFREEYVSFMREYESMGHMIPVPQEEVINPVNSTYYIPHHFVLKEDSTSTKFRIVYDASAPTTNGVSLNHTMMVGATIQSSLFDILLRFRTYPIAFTADIAKMYRQIRLTAEDRDLHRILWREEPTQPIREYKLCTVTYGTASAPFLATRCLHKLAELEGEKYPTAAAIMTSSFYVDDLMSGKDTTESAKQAIHELISLCASGGFDLRKWTCNNAEVLSDIPTDLRETKELIPLDDNATVKTLGIHWHPREDCYRFKIKPTEQLTTYTKRSVLSQLATLFDPIGWLAPVTVKAKLFMQQLWKLQIGWDSPLPSDMQQQWCKYTTSLAKLEDIRIPRFVLEKRHKVHLVGFADSSERCYGAVLYIYGEDDDGSLQISLLTSKSKVAPIHSVTLPRLELQAAVLLSELIPSATSALKIKFDSIRAYTDSTITLAWIQSDPNHWKTYVRNRIISIQNNVPASCWFHVRGEDNPADCVSRGLLAEELIHHSLWWNGNEDVFRQSSHVPEETLSSVQVEAKQPPPQCHLIREGTQVKFIENFSSLTVLKRAVANVLRMQANFRLKKQGQSCICGLLSCAELNRAMREIVKCVQAVCFSSEISFLKQGHQLPTNNRLLSLNPFIDGEGVLRVGGRLKNANISTDRKHPILLPRAHHLTKLVIDNYHLRYLHAGAQATLANINQKFWIVRGRDAVRYQLRKCVTCARYRATTVTQLMGNLPEARVTPSRPFLKSGVDYAGPIKVKNYGRSKVNLKAYLVLFVCFSTRALHLEVATSLSTDSFMSAFRRFISRRGKPSDMFSDCGTNFVGAKRILGELEADAVINSCANESITWHLNPPGSPNFGGLHEAGVKSVKYHLNRVMGSEALTYEELNSLVVQIEGILNSRPLTPVSSDPNDLEVLTPAHFLIGGPITAIPEPDLTAINTGRLDRFRMLQQKQQTFWKRWHKEFITRMQQRPKWMKVTTQIKLNDIVIIKEENTPPGKWKLGRVVELHPGEDGNVRVVTLKTHSGILKRSIHKLCLLPISNDVNNE